MPSDTQNWDQSPRVLTPGCPDLVTLLRKREPPRHGTARPPPRTCRCHFSGAPGRDRCSMPPSNGHLNVAHTTVGLGCRRREMRVQCQGCHSGEAGGEGKGRDPEETGVFSVGDGAALKAETLCTKQPAAGRTVLYNQQEMLHLFQTKVLSRRVEGPSNQPPGHWSKPISVLGLWEDADEEPTSRAAGALIKENAFQGPRSPCRPCLLSPAPCG